MASVKEKIQYTSISLCLAKPTKTMFSLFVKQESLDLSTSFHLRTYT